MFDNLYAKSKTANPINVKPLSQDKINEKYADRKRDGKTKKDRTRKNGTP